MVPHRRATQADEGADAARATARPSATRLLWFGLLVVFGGLGVYLWFSVWSLLCFAVYGVLYGSASDARWHECGHGTAFKTRWMNTVVYYIACFMIMRDPTVWRWSHARHHTDTIIVGRDPEIVAQRPPALVAHRRRLPRHLRRAAGLQAHGHPRLGPADGGGSDVHPRHRAAARRTGPRACGC